MGSENYYPEEAPVRLVSVEGFWIDETPVTNGEFAAFVNATAYVTTAEVAPTIEQYPAADPSLLQPGSATFDPIPNVTDLRDASQWWVFKLGACWRAPQGSGSHIAEHAHHPAVHVSFHDAMAYAAWAGKALPTEAQWEYAARGGLESADYAWGDSLAPMGTMMANYWQGRFPNENLVLDGYAGTSPVGTYPPNGYGLHDMIGNVWEWTLDEYRRTSLSQSPCCTTATSAINTPRVIKGGSFLCAENYCQRYRPAARHPQDPDTSTSHIGFRCVKSQNFR